MTGEETIQKIRAQTDTITLHLSLYAEYFTAILAGTKRIEYRRRCPHWDRALSKPYTHMHAVNGYGAKRPWLEVEITRITRDKTQWYIHISNITGAGNLHLLCPALEMISSSS